MASNNLIGRKRATSGSGGISPDFQEAFGTGMMTVERIRRGARFANGAASNDQTVWLRQHEPRFSQQLRGVGTYTVPAFLTVNVDDGDSQRHRDSTATKIENQEVSVNQD